MNCTHVTDVNSSFADHHRHFLEIRLLVMCSVQGTETVQVTPLRRTLASSPECTSCPQCFDTVGWAAGRQPACKKWGMVEVGTG